MKKSNQEHKGRVLPFERDGAFFLKRGTERLERNNLLEAISHYRKAQRREPENIEVQLAIAEVLTEMHRYEQSNKLLFPLLSLKESPSECFFGIACNFVGLQEFSQAHDSLESYLALDPEGEFVSDALDMLDVIEDESILYGMPGIQLPEEREALSICQRGRQLLESGRMEDAIRVLSDAADKYSEMRFVRSNLALAYFCKKDYKRAMEAVRSVLKEAPDDVQAHCNLLLFLHAAKDDEGVEREIDFLKRADTQDPQDWHRMAVVFMELGKMHEALAVLKKLQVAFPYDEGTLHRLAVCRYHLGQYEQALSCYDRLLKIDPADTIAAYYRRICSAAKHNRAEDIDWLFHYQVPYIEVLRRVRKINELSRLPHEERLKRWSTDENFRWLLFWSLRLPELSAKRGVLSMIASFGDSEAERVLRHFQLDQAQPDALKQDVFAMLKHMNAAEPYIAYLDGRLVQSKVSIRHTGSRVPAAYRRVFETVMESMQAHSNSLIVEATEIFRRYMESLYNLGAIPKLRPPQVYAAAAAIEYLACRNLGEEPNKLRLCSAYGITQVRLNNAINKLMQSLEHQN